jgi:hypothetical protein
MTTSHKPPDGDMTPMTNAVNTTLSLSIFLYCYYFFSILTGANPPLKPPGPGMSCSLWPIGPPARFCPGPRGRRRADELRSGPSRAKHLQRKLATGHGM